MEDHDLFLLWVLSVSRLEVDLIAVEFDETVIADGDPVSIPPEIIDHLLRASEWLLCIHDPLVLRCGDQEMFEVRVGS